MKKLLTICFLTISIYSQAQSNIVKLNLPGLFVRNYQVQFERLFIRKVSASLSLRYMPVGNIPFKKAIQKAVANEDADLKRTVDMVRIGNFAATPEFRLYLGKGKGKGFYLSGFYRYANFKSDNVLITYVNNIGIEQTVTLNGHLSSHTFGFGAGRQWKIGKIYIDWLILGPHFGSGSGSLTGISSQYLTEYDQQQVRDQLENLDIPLTKKEITVNSSGATLGLHGPWGGFRTALSVGVGF